VIVLAEMPEKTIDEQGALRGKGRGSRFFVLGRDHWAKLHTVETRNRLNLYITFLVLLAGTGSDNRTTKWSVSACDQHVGLGKPRARVALDELIAAGLVERVDGASRLLPQYRLPSVEGDEDPIFLPVQLVTGFAGEASILRRVRETGDPFLARMLIDLYGMVEIDAAYGVPLVNLRQGDDETLGARKIAEVGIFALWAAELTDLKHASGAWTEPHSERTPTGKTWHAFWERVATLEKIGALTFEPWLYESSALDAEPMFPIDFGVLYSTRDEDETSALSRLLMLIAEQMTVGREYLLERYANHIIVPLPSHHQAPAVRGVAKLRIEADSPGCRRAYALRMRTLEDRRVGYERLLKDAMDGRYDRPLGAAL
jgi:hypothetical protein